MLKCNKCGKLVEEAYVVCPNCGSTELSKMTEENIAKRASAPKDETISSGIDWLVVVLCIVAGISTIAALVSVPLVSDNPDRYLPYLILYATLSITSVFYAALVKGFSVIVKAAKVYLKKNGETL